MNVSGCTYIGTQHRQEVSENQIKKCKIARQWIEMQTLLTTSSGVCTTCIYGQKNLYAMLLKGSVERSRHKRHFCSLLPYFLLSGPQIFQLCLSFCTSSPDLVLFKKFLQEKEKYPKNPPKRLSSWHLHSFVNRAEIWYTASTYPSAKYVVTDFLISLQKSRYGRKTSKSAVLPYPVGFDEA